MTYGMNTVLFQDGDWRICRAGHPPITVLHHRCGDEFNVNNEWWHIGGQDKECVWCRSTVPDPIMGLYILHTWDRS